MPVPSDWSTMSNEPDAPVLSAIGKLVKSSLNKRGAYGVLVGTVLGSSYWVSFIGGIIMFKHLPRQMFGNVQSRLFPVYFTLQSASSAALLWLWTKGARPSNKTQLWRLNQYLLALCTASALANLVVVGPWTTAVMRKRHRLERLEGTTYDAPRKSGEMKELNKQFGVAHGVSSLLNLFFVVGATIHTAYISSNGLYIS